MGRYFAHLKSAGRLAAWFITRRKLGLGHPALPEWHVILGFDGLAQLDLAFGEVAGRSGPGGEAASRRELARPQPGEVLI
ncbi:MAG: DUF6614 family protein [Arenimonas sp.]